MELARGILAELPVDTVARPEAEESKLREWCRLRFQTTEEDFEAACRETGSPRFAAILLAALCGDVGKVTREVIADEFIIHRRIFLGQSDFPQPVRGFTSDELEFALQCQNQAAVERIMAANRLIPRDFRQSSLLDKQPACQEFLRQLLQQLPPVCLFNLRAYFRNQSGDNSTGVAGWSGRRGRPGRLEPAV